MTCVVLSMMMCLVGAGGAALWHHLRLAASLRTLIQVLQALGAGDWSARAGLTRGPLSAIAPKLDALASSVEQQLFEFRLSQTELEHLVVTDRLTGVGNRRAFDQQIELETSRSKRYGIPVSIIIFDIDHFKEVNDQYGHAVGDRVLIVLARRVASHLRDTDSIARWGGEEFCIIAPCTPITGAAVLAESIRRRVAEEPFEIAGQITVSLGVAQLLPGEPVAEWISRADKNLYEAKQQGRNRSHVASESGAPRAMFSLVWGPQYLTGHPSVDDEHEELFRLANEVVALSPDATSEAILERYDRFHRHVALHFESEERTLRELGCTAELEAHASLHRGILLQAEELRQRLIDGSHSLAEIGDFVVRRVAVGHLIAFDLSLFSHAMAQSGTIPVMAPSPPSIRVRIQRALRG